MQNKTQKMTINAMLAALCAVLGFVAINMGNMKITLESFPIDLGALLFGPIDGAIIAFLGQMIYQMMLYGFTATTLLWVIPGTVGALVLGGFAKAKGFKLTKAQTIAIVMLTELIITTLNTGALYIDSHIYGYYSPVFIFGTLVPRYALCIGKGIVYGVILYPLADKMKKFVK